MLDESRTWAKKQDVLSLSLLPSKQAGENRQKTKHTQATSFKKYYVCLLYG